ncbi:hypothetical protein IGI37_003720 [Enterococcus sp. AZ194]|uniref:hypothetical protein n=1 Tax=Enterococcus sp. AZ194 TaxID=2774629 RepID=UPI003F1EA9DD
MANLGKTILQVKVIVIPLIIRNLYLTMKRIRWRLLFISLLVVGLVVVSSKNADGITGVLYGVPERGNNYPFPYFWYFYLISPVLLIGDSQIELIKKDIRIVTRVPYELYLLSTFFILFIAALFVGLLAVIADGFVVENPKFLFYVILFSFVSMAFIQAGTFVVGNYYVSSLCLFFLLILSIYSTKIDFINATMMARIDSLNRISNWVVLLILLLGSYSLCKIKIQTFDFI